MIAHNLEVVEEQHEHMLCNFSLAILKCRHTIIGHDVEKFETIQSINNHTERFIRTSCFLKKPLNLKETIV